jgi:hypothetical protein
MVKSRVAGLGMKIAGTGIACALFALGGWLFVTRYYLPLRDVRPIVKLLEEGTPESIEAADGMIRGWRWGYYADGTRGMEKVEHRISIRGVGFEKVKQSILKVLASSDDLGSLAYMFLSIGLLAEEGHTGFRTDEDGAIIRKAVERYNAKQGEYGRYTVTTNTNGAYSLFPSLLPSH